MGQIHEALCTIMREVTPIAKDRRNQGQGYNFRGIDDIYNAIQPLIAKHGVFSVPEVVEERSEERQTSKGGTLIYRILKIRYTFFAFDGSFVQAVVIGEGMDSGDKASNKAMAVAHKYAWMQILAIPTEDAKDPENDNHDVLPKSAPPKPRGRREIVADIVAEYKSEVFTDAERAGLKAALAELKTNDELLDHLKTTREESAKRKDADPMEQEEAKIAAEMAEDFKADETAIDADTAGADTDQAQGRKGFGPIGLPSTGRFTQELAEKVKTNREKEEPKQEDIF